MLANFSKNVSHASYVWHESAPFTGLEGWAVQPLTFQHRTSVTPYTSPFGLARSYVLDKQSAKSLSLRPRKRGRPYPEVTAAILPSSLTTTHPFALVCSTSPPVSVFGTDAYVLCLETFLGGLCFQIPSKESFVCLDVTPADLPTGRSTANDTNPITCKELFSPSSLSHTYAGQEY